MLAFSLDDIVLPNKEFDKELYASKHREVMAKLSGLIADHEIKLEGTGSMQF